MTDLGTTAGNGLVGSRPTAAPTAAARTETTLAWAWGGFRAGAVIALVAAFASPAPHGARVVPATVLMLVTVGDCLVVGAVCLRRGRILLGWARFDVVCVVAVVGFSAWPAVLPGPPSQSYFYNFTVIAAPTIGLPAWRPAVTVAGGLGLALMDFLPSLRHGSSYPRWNALPDSVTVVGVAALAAVLARLLRGSAEALDRHRIAAMERAALLARQRERLRQQADLSVHLMATVDALAADDAIDDPAVTERLRAESRGLRQLIAAARSPHAAGLVPRLREVIVEKAATGLHVELEHGDGIGALADALPEAAAEALVAAAREALTNVRKHAGTDRASLSLAVADGGVLLTVTDRGRGYQASDTAEGFGQRRSLRQRIAAVGGRVQITSLPGSGTRVSLWVPL